MNRRRPRPAAVVTVVAGLATLLVVPGALAGPDSSGWLEIEAGHLAHPFEVAEEEASSYTGATLVQEFAVPVGDGRIELNYRGDLTDFTAENDPGYRHHALGLEYLHRVRDRSQLAFSAGIQGALRRQQPAYAVYDYDAVNGYLAAKTYPHPRLMLRGVAGLAWRRYEALPEESYVEPHLSLQLRHFSPSRLSLGAALRLGGKWYHDPAASRVWNANGTPSTAQLAASVMAAQGLSERLSLRATVEYRARLDDFPYLVDGEIFDNPLLDRYARSGWNAGGAVKWLMPQTIWLQLGLGWREDDYGEIRFRAADGAGSRQDHVVDLWLSVERQLGLADMDLRLRAHAAYTEQRSTLEAYTWSGPAAGAGLQWRW
jgi:hypothetical protein